MITIKTLCDRIIMVANDKNISLNAVAEKAGLSNGLLYRWRKRKKLPELDSIVKVSCALEVPVAYLLSEKEIKGKDSKIELITFKAMELSEESLIALITVMDCLK